MKTQNEMKQIAKRATKITGDVWDLNWSSNKREYWLQNEYGELVYWDEIPTEWEEGIQLSKGNGKMKAN